MTIINSKPIQTGYTPLHQAMHGVKFNICSSPRRSHVRTSTHLPKLYAPKVHRLMHSKSKVNICFVCCIPHRLVVQPSVTKELFFLLSCKLVFKHVEVEGVCRMHVCVHKPMVLVCIEAPAEDKSAVDRICTEVCSKLHCRPDLSPNTHCSFDAMYCTNRD